jgi:tetratricopeptide (TPR) repeat protein
LDREDVPVDFLASKIAAWKRHRTVRFAADVVTAGLVLGLYESVADAARYLLEAPDVPGTARRMARIVLGRESSTPSDEQMELPLDEDPVRSAVRQLRALLRDEPRNALMWADLALAYTSVGQSKKAEHAMRNALSLAPHNRLVLRSAARLYVHLGDAERAHEILRRSDAIVIDPWLMASEVAVATVANIRPLYLKRGKELIERGVHSPFHLAELRAALGTLEVLDGVARKGRRLFKDALEDPNDNTVAQAEWASRHLNEFRLESKDLKIPRSFEAKAWEAYWEADWPEALNQAKQWAQDEPFSVAPGMLASFLAGTVLEDYSEGAALARRSLHANPTDLGLKNNFVFALAKDGKLVEATTAYKTIDESDLRTPRMRVLWLATGGLLEFKSGDVARGRELYSAAAAYATEKGDPRLAALASGFLAWEELIAGTPEAAALAASVLPKLELDPAVGRPILIPKILALLKDSAAKNPTR